VSQESLGRQKSPHDEKQNRQGSPGGGAGSSGPVNEEDEEEDGNHDTITSLAGAKMMQWYHKALTGSRKSSNVSLNQVQRSFFCKCCCYLLAENKMMKNHNRSDMQRFFGLTWKQEYIDEYYWTGQYNGKREQFVFFNFDQKVRECHLFFFYPGNLSVFLSWYLSRIRTIFKYSKHHFLLQSLIRRNVKSFSRTF